MNTRSDLQCTLAHHFESLTNTVQRDMRLVIVGGVKVRLVIIGDDVAAAVRFAGFDVNMQRIAFNVHHMLDGVLYDRLQRERRHPKHGVRRIEADKETVLELRLLYSKIGAGMFRSDAKGTVFSLAMAEKFFRRYAVFPNRIASFGQTPWLWI